jgi:DNA polymerase III epsilon subunit family exonuclease
MTTLLPDTPPDLADVTFVVFDVETTGMSPLDGGITEIGAVKVRGGERLGTFHTLVNPGLPIPPMITVLTGITDALVAPAPPISAVLPSFCEFARGAVLVGHNIGYDVAFTDAALRARGDPPLGHPRVDTLALARRLLVDEVPDLKLGTLAAYLRTAHVPCHRALDDALATADVLHALIERLGTFGVTALDDLLAFRGVSEPAVAAKLRLVRSVPRTPGVYLFRDACGRVVFVGKAANLRARLRSWFAAAAGRSERRVLRATAQVEHVVTSTLLEAEVLELRAIAEHAPRFNRRRRPGWYVEVGAPGAGSPIAALRRAPDAGRAAVVTLGPFRSRTTARAVRDAVEHPPMPTATLVSGDGDSGARHAIGRAVERAWRLDREVRALQRAARVVLRAGTGPAGGRASGVQVVLEGGRLVQVGPDDGYGDDPGHAHRDGPGPGGDPGEGHRGAHGDDPGDSHSVADGDRGGDREGGVNGGAGWGAGRGVNRGNCGAGCGAGWAAGRGVNCGAGCGAGWGASRGVDGGVNGGAGCGAGWAAGGPGAAPPPGGDRRHLGEIAVVVRWLSRETARGRVRLVSSERPWECELAPPCPARPPRRDMTPVATVAMPTVATAAAGPSGPSTVVALPAAGARPPPRDPPRGAARFAAEPVGAPLSDRRRADWRRARPIGGAGARSPRWRNARSRHSPGPTAERSRAAASTARSPGRRSRSARRRSR